MKENKAIQIIGTQRSGSNLLRVMLNQSTQIDAPHPPHILQRFYPLLPNYGDLNNNQNFINLIDDVCKLIAFNPVPWDGFNPNTNLVYSLCENNSLVEIFRVVYTLKAAQSKASFWCCKSMSNFKYLEELENSGIKPYYIYLYRDGRDVALSFKKAIVGPKHIYHLATKWKEEQEQCIKLKEIVNKNRFFSICYEDLIQYPKLILKDLCRFLKIPFVENMLTYFQSNESIKTASSGEMWQNIKQPIIKNNSNKFLKEMTNDELSLFESIAGTTLVKLCYNLYSDYRKINIEENHIKTFNKENNLLIERALLNANKEDLFKKKKQLELLKTIENRGNNTKA